MTHKITEFSILSRLTVGLLLLLVLALTGASTTQAAGTIRIKDIVDFEGVRENMLVGYGLVVGLNGTGDSIGNSPFTEQSLIGMLERLGVNVRDQSLNTENVAAVIVTATLPPFATQGMRMDVNVSALGDAESLRGGTLLVTPLMGADGNVYAVSQGAISTSGFTASGDSGTSLTQNIPTAGRIAAGAIIEREIDFALEDMGSVRLALRNPDFTTARRIANTINKAMSAKVASALNPATVKVSPPANYEGGLMAMLTDIEQLRVTPDQIAKVVIDERSGVIVMGQEVKISTVAIAQGNLTIRITETPQVSQPNPFSENGDTVVVPRTNVSVEGDGDKKLAVLSTGISLQELVESLNALGVGPRDIITILQSIKAAGALQADIEVL